MKSTMNALGSRSFSDERGHISDASWDKSECSSASEDVDSFLICSFSNAPWEKFSMWICHLISKSYLWGLSGEVFQACVLSYCGWNWNINCKGDNAGLLPVKKNVENYFLDKPIIQLMTSYVELSKCSRGSSAVKGEEAWIKNYKQGNQFTQLSLCSLVILIFLFFTNSKYCGDFL